MKPNPKWMLMLPCLLCWMWAVKKQHVNMCTIKVLQVNKSMLPSQLGQLHIKWAIKLTCAGFDNQEHYFLIWSAFFLLEMFVWLQLNSPFIMIIPFSNCVFVSFSVSLSSVFKVLLCPRVWTSLENGRVTVKPPGPPVEGTVLHYSCHAGFILEGRNISHCTKLGKWDAPKPTCLCEYPSQCD